MRHPAQGATGGWVMAGLVFQWFCSVSVSFPGPHCGGVCLTCYLTYTHKHLHVCVCVCFSHILGHEQIYKFPMNHSIAVTFSSQQREWQVGK